MRRFLLLALTAGFLSPSAAIAETWWLMAAGKFNQAAGSTAHRWSIPTNSEQECEFAGQKYLNAQFPNTIGTKARGYVCVKGK